MSQEQSTADLPKRLKLVLDHQKMSREQLAELCDVSMPTVSRWLNGKSNPYRKYLHLIADATPFRLEWLESGEGPPKDELGELELDVGEDREPQMVTVRHFGDVSAGPGRVNLEAVSHEVMPRTQYHILFGSRRPGRVGLFRVRGDSAAPTYFDGEDVPVEIQQDVSRFRDDGVYVYRYRDDRQLKRLRRLEGGTVRARSLNPGIDDQTLKPTENEFQVLAEVIQTSKQQLYSSMIGRFMRSGRQDERA